MGDKINNLLKMVLDQSNIGVMIMDANGVVIYVNHAYSRMVRYDAEHPVEIGSNMQYFIDNGYINSSAALQALQEKRTIVAMNVIGKEIPILVSSQPIFEGPDHISFIITTVHDRTEFDTMQKELADCQAQLLELEHALSFTNENQTNVIAVSSQMRSLISYINQIKDLDSTILLRGESGSGKDVIANYIHAQSKRKDRPFIAINCAAIPEPLLESELFGYKSGSFTGAARQGKVGQLEAAGEGTVFLDEIGELPISMQAKLLRVLENNTFTKVGDFKETPFKARVIAATNRKLEEMVSIGKFREDLYYRLNVISFRIPPLCERREDIVPLALYFLNKYNNKYGFKRQMSSKLLAKMSSMPWPGNARELKNKVEQMVIMSPIDTLTEDSLNGYFTEENVSAKAVEVNGIVPLKDAVKETEIQLLRMAKEQYGTCRKIADALDIDFTTVSKKMKLYHIE